MVSKPKPECSVSKSAKSQPAAFRIWPIPGVANSTMKCPSLSSGLAAISFRPGDAMVLSTSPGPVSFGWPNSDQRARGRQSPVVNRSNGAAGPAWTRGLGGREAWTPAGSCNHRECQPQVGSRGPSSRLRIENVRLVIRAWPGARRVNARSLSVRWRSARVQPFSRAAPPRSRRCRFSSFPSSHRKRALLHRHQPQARRSARAA